MMKALFSHMLEGRFSHDATRYELMKCLHIKHTAPITKEFRQTKNTQKIMKDVYNTLCFQLTFDHKYGQTDKNKSYTYNYYVLNFIQDIYISSPISRPSF